jgi:hypothetical protein
MRNVLVWASIHFGEWNHWMRLNGIVMVVARIVDMTAGD